MKLKSYFSLVKISHTIFALPFALIGFFTALFFNDISFSWQKFLLVLGCMLFARNAAMAFNRWVDANIDANNPRTATREIPAGILKADKVMWFTILNCTLFTLCTWFINPICFFLSPIALLVVLGYSFTKRFTRWCHFVLGIGLALAPIGAYLAVTGSFNTIPVMFGLTVLTWVAGFDVIYSLQDELFDRQNNLHSIPVKYGKKRALVISELLHVSSVTFLIIAGLMGNFSIWYLFGVLFFGALLIYQHLLVKPNDLSKVNIAFFTTNGIASIVFFIFVIIDLLTK